MGDSTGSRKTAPNASHYELHVGQLVTDFLDHDGVHAVRGYP